MNLNTNCTDGTTLNGAALAQTEKADTATWSAWQVPISYKELQLII